MITGLVILLVILIFSYLLVSRNHLTDQAYINGKIVTLKSPVPGTVAIEQNLSVGSVVMKNEMLAQVSSGAENLRLSELVTLIAELDARKNLISVQLAKLITSLNQRQSELATLQPALSRQQELDIAVAVDEKVTARTQVAAAEAEIRFQVSNFQRHKNLLATHAVSEQAFDAAEAAYHKSSEALESAKSRLERASMALIAAKSGLQPEGVRGLPYVVTRTRELLQQTTDIQAEIKSLENQKNIINEEKSAYQNEHASQRKATLHSPVNGVVWDIAVDSGGSVERSGTIIQLVDCEHLWVDAFVKENRIHSLKVGASVMLGDLYVKKTYQGRIEAVRNGTDRVHVGDYVVPAPPDVMRRQLPVRIANVRISINDGLKDILSHSFCNAGKSLKVSFN